MQWSVKGELAAIAGSEHLPLSLSVEIKNRAVADVDPSSNHASSMR
jgi:hypothetical protein